MKVDGQIGLTIGRDFLDFIQCWNKQLAIVQVVIARQMRAWRNWQTRMVEGHVPVREWRFESSRPHFFNGRNDRIDDSP